MTLIYYIFSLASGVAISMQVGINGKLRSNIGSPVLASLVSFVVGALALAITYFIAVFYGIQTVPSMSSIKHTSWWMWTGGLFGAFYICTTIFATPKIGLSRTLSLIIAGQIITAVIFDNLGIFNNSLRAITPIRLVGVVFLILGVYIIQTF